MRMQLGERGTEQFEINISLNGHKFPAQKLHDPFIRTRIGLGRWALFKALFRKQFEVRVSLDGTEGVIHAILTLDPELLSRDTREILEARARSREIQTVGGFCSDLIGEPQKD
jgi:hypothetical protein